MKRNKATRTPAAPKVRFRLPCKLCTSYTCDGYCDKLTDADDDVSIAATLLPPHHDNRHSSWAG